MSKRLPPSMIDYVYCALCVSVNGLSLYYRYFVSFHHLYFHFFDKIGNFEIFENGYYVLTTHCSIYK